MSTADASYTRLTDEDRASIKILVVDDEATLRDTCVNVLRMHGYDVTAEGRGDDALETIRRKNFDIMLLDLYMTGVPGAKLLEAALERRSSTLVVMMTGNPSVESNLDMLRAGAWDYLPKPFSATHVEVLIGRAAHAVIAQRAERQDPDQADGEAAGGQDDDVVVGTSKTIRATLDLARKVARSNASVFITGESGSGKELIANFIHRHSRRASRPMVPINCAALPEPLLESEMFGHAKGAFTGAVSDKAGLFEIANGGTLFLDELTEMSAAIQAKLLRVIQDGVVRRVGSNQANSQVDVRIIAATNRDPREAVEAGDLRPDLYYRLRVVPMHVPPLRERREDIPVLANHFLQRYWRRDNPRSKLPRFTDEAVEALQRHSWPGNVRELQNVVEHSAVLVDAGADIEPGEIPFMHEDGFDISSNGTESVREMLNGLTDLSYHDARETLLAEFERTYLTSLVSKADGNMSKAARMAGVDRTTLYRLIEKHNLERGSILRSK
jgi:DNA-binding NtrC family response regulator